MQVVGDTIQLDGRRDIDKLMAVLDAYITAHPYDDNEELKKLKDDLDTLWYRW